MDADRSKMEFKSTYDINGIVLIDEADLHLHVGLQYEVLPKLIALFPKIQFIMSVHAPLVSLGLEKFLGENKFEIRELPSGIHISTETYSEFLSAFNAYATTRKFQSEILAKLNATTLPALLVEGKTDALHIAEAWVKLHPGIACPVEIIPCGVEAEVGKREGGAETLRRCLEFLSIVTDRVIVGLFDNDRPGNEQFNGLKDGVFCSGTDLCHKKHIVKQIHAILLPAPASRNNFVSITKMTHRYLSIEHYFSNEILMENGFVPNFVAPDSSVFEIDASSKIKLHFAMMAKDLSVSEFANFQLLFDRLAAIGALNNEGMKVLTE